VVIVAVSNISISAGMAIARQPASFALYDDLQMQFL
jgi:hypothetical protein